MTHRTLLSLLLTALALPAGCLYDDFDKDGARCSEANTCPPGQRCSKDGECLKPCPVLGCVGASCGCDRLDFDPGNSIRICQADGLCHVTCASNPESACVGHCDVAAGICRPSCDNSGCANDAGCQEVSTSPLVRICVGDWPDGGPGDDGGPGNDAAACTDCGGGCVDLDTDSQHCGACDHACAGGECLGGRCQPLAIGALPGGTSIHMAQTSSELYLSVRGGDDDGIYRCGKVGCLDPPEVVVDATRAGDPGEVVATSSDVYWIDHTGDSRLLRCPNLGCTGEPTVLWTENVLSDLAANDEFIFFVPSNTDTGVKRCALPDCAGGPETFSTALLAGPILVDETSVYFVENALGEPWIDSLYACDLTGCAGAPRLVTTEVMIGELAQDAQTLYLIRFDLETEMQELRSCAKTGCLGGSTLIHASGPTANYYLRPAASSLGLFWREPPGLLGWWPDCPDCPRSYSSADTFAIVADDFYVFFVDQEEIIYRLVPR